MKGHLVYFILHTVSNEEAGYSQFYSYSDMADMKMTLMIRVLTPGV